LLLLSVIDLGSLTLDALDSVSDIDSQTESVVYDTLGPPTAPPPPATAAWMTQYAAAGKPYTPSYMSPGIVSLTGHIPAPPAPYNFVNDAMSLDSLLIANGADTVQSSSGMSNIYLYLPLKQQQKADTQNRGQQDKHVNIKRKKELQI